MNRPSGLVATVVLLVLGGLLCLLIGAMVVVAFEYAPPSEILAGAGGASFLRIAEFFAGAFLGFAALWQFAAAIGLWRLKPWGRILLLSFSAVMVSFQALGLLSVFLLPIAINAPDLPADAAALTAQVRMFLIPFYAIPLAVGIWWLIYFNRPKVKALFAPGGQVVQESPPPLSIVTIGWFVATSAAVWPFAIYWHWSAVFLWMALTGWSAAVVNTLWCAAMLYAGIGLLRWKMSGYWATVALFAFGIVNGVVFWTAPGAEERMRRMVQGMSFPGMERLVGEPALPSRGVLIALGLLGTAIPLYFLLTRKARFIAAGEARRSGSKTVSARRRTLQ